MAFTSTIQDLAWLTRYWRQHPDELAWEPLFVLPPWLETWTKHFAGGQEPEIAVVAAGESIIGVAPLLVTEREASIIGSPDVCDYEDFPVAPGHESEFASGLLAHLRQRGIASFEPGIVRPDSTVMSTIVNAARQAGATVSCEPDELSLEKDMPATWDAYLQSLDGKQRHELKRKLRRLEEAGRVEYRIITAPAEVPAFLDAFLKMFVESRTAKARFLTLRMEAFFRDLVKTMSSEGLFVGGLLDIDGSPAAAVLAFDHHGVVYLYNSGFDPARSQLSVGIISKALLIKHSIEQGRRVFNFLKGDEHYKYHLGGKEVHLQKCRIELART